MKLRHDNAHLNASWFVNRVEIRDLETDKLYPFIIERWLSKKKEDQKIERTFYVKGYEVKYTFVLLRNRAKMSGTYCSDTVG
jgi:hypothetical protein